jgi:hypothetical protein
MSNQLNISGPIKPLAKFFQRFHTIIFILFIFICLVIAVLLLYRILNNASVDSSYLSPISAGTIDQTTLNRINALHSSSGPYPEPITPTGRISPFGE